MLIGITGKAGSGKDTAAKALIDIGWKRFAFADELKNTVNSLFGWNSDHSNGHLKELEDTYWGFSPRRAYQLFGTEFGRALDEDLWIKKAIRSIDIINDNYVITDVRFENEATFVRENGKLIHIVGREYDNVEGHASEGGVEFGHGDVLINNNKSIHDLQQLVLDIAKV